MRQFDFQVVNPLTPWTELHFSTPRFVDAFCRITEADWNKAA